LDGGKTFEDTYPDSGYQTVITPESAPSLKVMLRVTDDDGAEAYTNATVYIPILARFDSSGGQEWHVGAGSWVLSADKARFQGCDSVASGAAFPPCLDWKAGFIWSGKRPFSRFQMYCTLLPAYIQNPKNISFLQSSWVGVVFGLKDSANFLGLTMGPSSTEFFESKDGLYRKLQEWPNGYSAGSRSGALASLEVSDDSLRFAFNNVTRYLSAPLPEKGRSGYVGFLAQHDWAEFTSIRLFTEE
jgi:hypothetical protein